MEKKADSLISSILFLVIGILLFLHPDGVVKFITYIVGSIFVGLGIIKVLSYYKIIKKENITNTSDIVLGIIAIDVGLTIILCSGAIEIATRLVIGAWILYSGIMKLTLAFKLKELNSKTWVYTLIVSILMIICGIYIIAVSNIFFKTLGLFLIIYSIIEIIQFITIPKNLHHEIIKK